MTQSQVLDKALAHRRHEEARLVEVRNACPGFRAPIRPLRELFSILDRLGIAERIPEGDLSIAFLSRTRMCRLHQQFLGDPGATDVVTFPTLGEGMAGEICVCPEVAALSAPSRKLPFANELTLYLVHGWLHLAGHEDHSAASRRRMRAAEARIFRALEASGWEPVFSYRGKVPTRAASGA